MTAAWLLLLVPLLVANAMKACRRSGKCKLAKEDSQSDQAHSSVEQYVERHVEQQTASAATNDMSQNGRVRVEEVDLSNATSGVLQAGQVLFDRFLLISKAKGWPVDDPHFTGTKGSVQKRFSVRGKAGKGVFGVAYFAWDKDKYKKQVVVKLFHYENSEGKETLLRKSDVVNQPDELLLDAWNHVVEEGNKCDEAKQMAATDNTACPHCYERIAVCLENHIDRDDGFSYLVLEKAGQQNLFDYWNSRNWTNCEKPRPPLASMRRWSKQLIEGQSQLKAANMVHRDIKPENLMMDAHGNITNIKYIDFGIMTTVGDQSCPECGTPPTMPPEHLVLPEYKAPDVDLSAQIWTDTYGVGATIYWMVCGGYFLEHALPNSPPPHDWQSGKDTYDALVGTDPRVTCPKKCWTPYSAAGIMNTVALMMRGPDVKRSSPYEPKDRVDPDELLLTSMKDF